MQKPLLFIVMLLFIFTNSLVSQPYYFRHYQVEQGLSNNTVFCCAQDKRGFFWLGTKDGLNRFDGYTFKTFRNDGDDTTSIGDNFVRSLYISDDNSLYAGTRNGVYRYNEHNESFALFYPSTEEIKDIKTDRAGNAWIVAGQTLTRFNGITKQVKQFPPNTYFAATSVCIDQQGNVWVSTADGLLEKYDPARDNFTSFKIFNKENYASPKWIEKIYATTQQSILVGTSNYGVKLFDLADYSSKDIVTYNPDKTEIFARDFIQTSDTEYWMATESGIFIYNSQSGKTTNLKKQYGNPYSISDNAIYSLYKDKEGGIWAGTYFGGINYFPKQYTAFEKFYPGYNNRSLSGNAVREICEDQYGNIWVGTEDAGLNKLDKATGIFKQYKPSGASKDISYSNIHGLLAKGNELWIGTFEHGLDIMNIKTGKVIKHYPSGNRSNILKSSFIVVIYQAKNGQVYTGTRQGLYRFMEDADNFYSIPQIPSYCFIHSILEDKNGILWIGTMGNGLYFYDPVTRKSGHFGYDPKIKKGLPGNSVTTLFISSNGQLWIGTEGGGLCSFNPQDSSFTGYTAREGFPSNTIFKILEDDQKRLWATTSKGLVSFDYTKKNVQVYTTSNGLLSNQFNYNSGYKDATGKMYLGSAKGLIRFNPDSFSTNTFTPPVYITSLYINEKELPVNKEGSPVYESISFMPGIELAYGQSSFSLDFAALSFTAPEMIEYKYIMEGLDKDWTYLKTNRKVYFTDLSPGTYTFKVIATNSSGIWSSRATTLIINILPPFWASRTAYVLYFLLSALLIYYLIRNYHNRVIEKTRRKIEFLEHEKEKEIYTAKMNFFTNIAHEIKTPLSLIKAPMERIIEKAGDNTDIGPNLRIMERNTVRLVELTNQLLNFRRMETNGSSIVFTRCNITELLQERFSSFKLLADQKDINFNITLPGKPVMADVNADAFQKIINNLLYNALNYCFQKADIRLLPDGDMFIIRFRNDGHLINPAMSERIFQPFFRLKETENKPGSGIGLSLSRSLVELHKGSLHLSASENGLNVFVLTLPLNQENKAPN
jgi:ligand-binding sensor domain-containing protein/signal transduction histidine kinase